MSKLEEYAQGKGSLLNAKKVVEQGLKNKPLVIEAVDWVQINEGEPEKPVVSFRGVENKLVLNKSNCATLIKELGKNEQEWAAKTIMILITQKKYQGENVDAMTVAVVA